MFVSSLRFIHDSSTILRPVNHRNDRRCSLSVAVRVLWLAGMDPHEARRRRVHIELRKHDSNIESSSVST